MVGAGAGGVASQLIVILTLPVISRLYNQSNIGEWSVWLGSAAIVGNVAYLRYELAIVVADDDEAGEAFWLCILLLTLGTVAAFLACLLPGVRKFIGGAGGTSWWVPWSAPGLVFGLGLTQILQSWCVRLERYWLLSFSQIVLAVGTAISQILAGLIGSDVSGLALGSLTGQWSSAVVLVVGIGSGDGRPVRWGRDRRSLLSLSRKYRAFALYSAPYTLFGVLRDRASLLVLQGFLTASTVGQYAYAWRSLNFPVSLLSGAIRPVLFRDSARDGVSAIEHTVVRILRVLALTGTPFLVLFLSMPRDLFALVFGSGWAQAGDIGVWIVWPIFTFLFCNWLDRVMDVMKQQRLSLLLEMLFSVLSLAGMIVAFLSGGGLGAALGTQACILVTYNLVYLLVSFRMAGFQLRTLRIILTTAVAVGAASAAILWTLRQLLSPWASAAAFIVFILASFSIAWFLKLLDWER